MKHWIDGHVGRLITVLAGSAIPILVALVAIRATTKLLNPTDLGVVATFWTSLSAIATFDFGIGRLFGRYVAKNQHLPDEVSRTKALCIYVLASLGLAMGILGAGVSLIVRPSTSLTLLAYCLTVAPIIVVGTGVRVIWESEGRFFAASTYGSAGNVVIYGVPSIAFYLGVPVDAALVITIALRLIVGVAGILAIEMSANDKRAKVQMMNFPSQQFFRNVLGSSGWALSYSLSCMWAAQADRLLVVTWFPLRIVANYTLPMDMVQKVGIIPALAMRVFNPVFDRHADGSDMSHIAKKGYMVSAGFAVVLCLIAPFSPIAVSAWMGQQFAIDTKEVFVIALCIVGMSAMIHVISGLIVANERLHDLAVSHIAVTVTSTLALLWTIGSPRIETVAYVVLFKTYFELSVIHWRLSRIIPIGVRLRSAVLAVVLVVSAIAVTLSH